MRLQQRLQRTKTVFIRPPRTLAQILNGMDPGLLRRANTAAERELPALVQQMSVTKLQVGCSMLISALQASKHDGAGFIRISSNSQSHVCQPSADVFRTSCQSTLT